jgi:exodeoxyribonuclease VII large subunit
MRQQNRMGRMLRQQIRLTRERLAHSRTRLSAASPQNRLNENRTRTLQLEEKLNDCMEEMLKEREGCLADFREALQRHMERRLQEKKTRLILLANSLEGNSPIKRLAQGYAFVEGPDHRAVHSVGEIRPADEIAVQMLDGGMKAVVSEVWKNERKK